MFDIPEKASNQHQVKQPSLSFHVCHQYGGKKIDLCAYALVKLFAFPQTIRAKSTRSRPVKPPELYARPSRGEQEIDVAV